jgi:hypothetical protein
MAVTLTPMTLGEIKTEVRTLVGDAASLSTAFSDQTVIASINFAVEHFFKATGKSYTEAELTKSGSTFPLPNSYIMVARAGYKPTGGSNTWLLNTTIGEETNRNPDWQTLVGTPKRWMIFDGAKIRLTPNPTSGTCVIGYVEEPTNMVNDADVVDSRIPVPYQRFLKYAAAAWLFEIDGDTQDMALAANHFALFTEFIKEVVTQ